MKNDKHPLDEYFKEGLEGHTLRPSQNVWDKIEAAQPAPEKKRKGGWYIMRAAVVVLLIGLSSVLYYQNNVNENWATAPDHTETDGSGKEKKGDDQQKTANEVQTNKNEKSAKQKEEPKPRKKPVPIMRQSTGRQIYVSTHEALIPVDEAQLMDDPKPMLASIDLKVKETAEPAPVKIKFRVKPRVTTEGFYANAPEEEKPLKEKVYAYASNQFDNLLKGRPVELPKSDKKPQLEIDLGKIFNN